VTCAGGLIGVGLTAAFAIGLAFLADARWRGAFFGAFFLIVLVLLANVVFFRVAAFVPGVFLRFAVPLPLAFFLVAITNSLGLHNHRLVFASAGPVAELLRRRLSFSSSDGTFPPPPCEAPHG
jgi:hypothetical protein